jgi:hypothetical protein
MFDVGCSRFNVRHFQRQTGVSVLRADGRTETAKAVTLTLDAAGVRVSALTLGVWLTLTWRQLGG